MLQFLYHNHVRLFRGLKHLLAITLARNAVLTEGATEPILLPRLFREATGVENLGFQVGPGLSSISIKKCKSLEHEANTVLFFVDGDDGGIAITKKLIEGQIDKENILCLKKKHIIEDYVDSEILLNSVNDILFNYQQKKLTLKPKDIPSTNCMEFIEKKCIEIKLTIPSKVLIAESLVMMNSQNPIIKQTKVGELKKLFVEIKKKMKIDL